MFFSEDCHISSSFAPFLLFFATSMVASTNPCPGAETLPLWPATAPGETSVQTGQAQPPRAGEQPPVTRVVKIRRPTLEVFLPQNANGTAVLVLPGGGFAKVVPDKEGSEAAPWLHRMGIATFVLRYRTNEITPATEPPYLRPLQDAQRAIRIIREHADRWNIKKNRVGVLGFSAGGQVAAILHTASTDSYPAADKIDQQSSRPDFSLLIYPWRVLNGQKELLTPIKFSDKSPPAFIVHTHDDASSSLGSVLIYAALKRHNVPAELHIYSNGGHGYGMRPVKGSDIGTWPQRAEDWLIRRGLGRPAPLPEDATAK